MKQLDAYKMMVAFLEDRYFRCPTDELGALLGALTISADGRPFDQAMSSDWDYAVERVASEQQEPMAMLKKAS